MKAVIGVCREDNPHDVDEAYGKGTYERFFPENEETADEALERLNNLDDKFIDVAAYFDARRVANAFRSERNGALDALESLFNQIESGVLVRNIKDDDKPDWAMKALQLTLVLKQVYALLNKE